LVLILAGCFGATALAASIHVATNGNDGTGNGSPQKPFATINKAASLAQPGDEVVIHEGTYRELVVPPRGGTSEGKRIVYRAAKGEDVHIKGSERITTWVKGSGSVWSVTLDNSFFNGYNPYALSIRPGPKRRNYDYWIKWGDWHHRGDIHIDGKDLFEIDALEKIRNQAYSWYCTVANNKTQIHANFGGDNPNTAMTEINVRRAVFFPDKIGLRYITLRGLHFSHAADSWSDPGGEGGTQRGAVGTRWGYKWIIEKCRITSTRCTGLVLGRVKGAKRNAVPINWGYHLVRNNHIANCGQVGILGAGGPAGSIIDNNLIENINPRNEFGGGEVAGIKFHHAVDVLISNNLIRDVHSQKNGQFGIWLDWGATMVRVTGNIIYRTHGHCMKLECTHGPILIDNNIFVGQRIRSAGGDATVVVHNLFMENVGFDAAATRKRRSPYYKPHTLQQLGTAGGICRDEKIFNNIFVEGTIRAPTAAGQEYADNVYVQVGTKPRLDKTGVVDPASVGFTLREDGDAVSIEFTAGNAPFEVDASIVDAARIGTISLSKMTIEDRDANPITVNTDYYGRPIERGKVIPGPFQNLSPNKKRYVVWPKSTEAVSAEPSIRRAPRPARNRHGAGRLFDIRGRSLLPCLKTAICGRRATVPTGLHLVPKQANAGWGDASCGLRGLGE
jgi:hypothetical protein